jgi:hypothetical protein
MTQINPLQQTINQQLSQAYSCCMDLTPRNYPIPWRVLEQISMNHGALLLNKTPQTFTLYYDKPIQVVQIGYAIGNYLKSKP